MIKLFSIVIICILSLNANTQKSGIKFTLLSNGVSNLMQNSYKNLINLAKSTPVQDVTRSNYTLSNAKITTLNSGPTDATITTDDDSINVVGNILALNLDLDVDYDNTTYKNVQVTTADDVLFLELKPYQANQSVVYYVRNITLTLNNIRYKSGSMRKLPFDKGFLVAVHSMILKHFQNNLASTLLNLAAPSNNAINLQDNLLSLNTTNLKIPYIDSSRITFFQDGSFFLTHNPEASLPILSNNLPDWDSNSSSSSQVLISDDSLNSALFGYWSTSSLDINIGNSEFLGLANANGANNESGNNEQGNNNEGNNNESGNNNENKGGNNAEGANSNRGRNLQNNAGSQRPDLYNYTIVFKEGKIVANNSAAGKSKGPKKPIGQGPKNAESGEAKAHSEAGNQGGKQKDKNNEAENAETPSKNQTEATNEEAPKSQENGEQANQTSSESTQGEAAQTNVTEPIIHFESPQNIEVTENSVSATSNQTQLPESNYEQAPQNNEQAPQNNEQAAQNNEQNAQNNEQAQPQENNEQIQPKNNEEAATQFETRPTTAPRPTLPPQAALPSHPVTNNDFLLPPSPYFLIPPVDLNTNFLDPIIPGLLSTYGPGRPVVMHCYYDASTPPQLHSNGESINGTMDGTCQVYVNNDQGWNQAVIFSGTGQVSAELNSVQQDNIELYLLVNSIQNLRVSSSSVGIFNALTLQNNINDYLLANSPFTTLIRIPLNQYGSMNNQQLAVKNGYFEILGDFNFTSSQ